MWLWEVIVLVEPESEGWIRGPYCEGRGVNPVISSVFI